MSHHPHHHHEHDHDHGHHSHEHGAGQKPFSDQEWAVMQADDVKAGKAVVGLMMGIFGIGLILYLGVCIVVASYPISG